MSAMKHPHDKLTCSQDQFESVHRALDKVRSTSTTVTVDRAALQALLIDHSKLIVMQEKTHGL